MRTSWTLRALAGIALCGAASSAFSAEPAPVQLALASSQNQTLLLSQDPLTKQILSQLTKENGGVKAVVRAANGSGVELASTEPASNQEDSRARASGNAAIPALTPHPDLVKKTKAAAPAKRKPARKASEQLKVLKDQGKKQSWESSKPSEPKDQPAVQAENDIY
ncbi:MAG: hypothetical protein WC943_01290 [Elusimicrobiota bacterium]|jgi:hypothetical protein